MTCVNGIFWSDLDANRGTAGKMKIVLFVRKSRPNHSLPGNFCHSSLCCKYISKKPFPYRSLSNNNITKIEHDTFSNTSVIVLL